jgi:putative tricarboxylic transport membrane protein
MDLLHNIAHGFEVALTPINFLYCVIGATLGTFVGVLPGLGPLATIAMLLPITFKIPALASLIMLTGIYYSAHHSGSTTAIMLNMPGEPSSIMICVDGHPMARQGRAGPALCISALGSFFAGCVCVIIIAVFSPTLAEIALNFGAAEYTSLVVLALLVSSALAGRSLVTTVAMAVLGILLGTIGTDVNTGRERFTFGIDDLADGMSFVMIGVGFFAFTEIISQLGKARREKIISAKVQGLFPTRADLKAAWKPILRGTTLGAILGVLPGTGPLVCSFAAYSIEKKIAKDPSRFGKGAIEGVAAPEAADNAAAFTHFIPMLTLGIPAGAPMALMLGALTIQGISPGPQLMTEHADLFWGAIASMWIGNMMLLVLNLPLIGIWIRLLMIPYRFLYPAIMVFCCIGVYSLSSSSFEVYVAAGMGVLGYVLHELDCPAPPLILGFILGPILEENLRRALLISRGDPMIFLERPISLALLLLAAAMLLIFCTPLLRKKPQAVLAEQLAEEGT